MKRYQFIGGILLLVAGLLMFLWLDSEAATPIGIGLTAIGIVLVAVSRKRS